MKSLNSTFILPALAYTGQCLAASPGQCTSLVHTLARRLSSDSHIDFAELISAGRNLTVPQSHETCDPFNSAIDFDFCRVGITTTTGSTSAVTSEVWLPSDWTGRVLTVGNGGLGGCIAHSNLLYGAQRGFAVVGTDNGHVGNQGKDLADAGILEDYAWRSVHTAAGLVREVSEAYYKKSHDKSYYLGCSTGGRQGFVEAQEFPDDFDGIVAGAPAFALSALQSWSGHLTTITGPPGSPTFLSPELWAVVMKDVFRQCDWLDGYEDGILEHTDLCNYIPEGLLCGSSNTTSLCLTGPQAETVRGVLSPLYDSEGNMIYSRHQPGTDSSRIMWKGSLEGAYVLDWFRYVVYNDPSWTGPPVMADIEASKKRGAEVFGLEGFNGDLSGSRDAGVKILHYHGLQDPVISAENSGRYYEHVARTMGLPPAELNEFYRFFRISGMSHCAGGTGASYIGSDLRTLAGEGADENVLAAIVKWVEEGVAPEHVLGTAFGEGREVKFQRRHCRYPLRNMYKGEGDPNSADSWECK
ncbi:related to feruloyl esterase B precursor [Cephalotrichum gorgonifer]|uniref:Carboxylic ester hydrolase n=1 Tax=Cephalotrichum gorgonifer TaxID=2041049 RepID=A0AAE8STA5_9PEZI|nr:related to feruloyl esterase B precursor [Cephalotrichum gorgonifer]